MVDKLNNILTEQMERVLNARINTQLDGQLDNALWRQLWDQLRRRLDGQQIHNQFRTQLKW